MQLTFYKYQGTGNDFVIIDNRHDLLSKNDTKTIQRLCNRKFGIGADGLILLEEPSRAGDDFTMVYFNADGKESSMCGNGGRCIVAFAKFLGIIENKTKFTAIDGPHEATVEDHIVGIKMMDIDKVEVKEDHVFLNTGSPHHILFSEKIDLLDVRRLGAEIRHSEAYEKAGGTNVNFVEAIDGGQLKVRTFERGVEDETLSCGTGVTAVALAAYTTGKTKNRSADLETPGGKLTVSFEAEGTSFRNIWLKGPAEQVFQGIITC